MNCYECGENVPDNLRLCQDCAITKHQQGEQGIRWSAWVAALEVQWRSQANHLCARANTFERNGMLEHAQEFRVRAQVYFECADELAKAGAANAPAHRRRTNDNE